MKKLVSLVSLALVFALLLAFIGCGGKTKTVMLNRESSLYCNGVMMEVTVRELKIEKNTATARIRFLNRSDGAMNSVGALVEFLDKDGKVLFTDEINESAIGSVAVGESYGYHAVCEGSQVKNIVDVRVSELPG